MEKSYRIEGYRVVANHWPLADGRFVSCYPLGPRKSTRYQAKKLLAKLRRTMQAAAWLHSREVGVQQGRWL